MATSDDDAHAQLQKAHEDFRAGIITAVEAHKIILAAHRLVKSETSRGALLLSRALRDAEVITKQYRRLRKMSKISEIAFFEDDK